MPIILTDYFTIIREVMLKKEKLPSQLMFAHSNRKWAETRMLMVNGQMVKWSNGQEGRRKECLLDGKLKIKMANPQRS